MLSIIRQLSFLYSKLILNYRISVFNAGTVMPICIQNWSLLKRKENRALKTLFNIVKAPLQKLLNFDVCVV